MAGSLKYFQLQKDLLKKAEEAAKKKKEADAEVNLVREIMRTAKEKDISLTDLSSLSDDLQKIFSEGDYAKTMELAKEFKTKSSPFLKEEVERAATTVYENVNIAKVSRISLGENIPKLLSHMEKGEFADAFALVYKCREETAKLLREEAMKFITQAEKMLPLVPGLGGDPKRFEEVIKDAKKYLEEGLVSDAIGRVSAIVSSISTLSKGEIVKVSKEIEKVIPIASEHKVDLSKHLKELEKANEMLAKHDVSGAMDAAKEVQFKAQDDVKGIVKNIIDEVDESYASAKEIGADLTKVDKLLSLSRDSQAKKDHLDAIRHAVDAMKALDGVCLTAVMDHMNRLKPKFILGRKIKPDLSKPMGLLKEARDAVTKKDYKKALSCTAECDKEVSAIVGEFESLRAEITSIEDSVNQAASLGADASALGPRVEITKSLLEEKDFGKVKTLLIGIRRDIDKLLSNTVINTIEEGEKVIQAGDKLGIDTTAFAQSLDKATAAMNAGEHEAAVKTASDAIASIKKELNSKVEEIMMNVEGGIASLTDERKADVKELYSKIEAAIKADKGEEAWTLASDLIKKMEDASSQEVNRVLREARDYLDVLAGMKGKDALLEKKYELAIESLEKKESRTALKIASDLIGEVKKNEKALAEHSFNMAKDILVDVRKRGANIEDVRPLLQESRNAMDKEDFKSAIESAMKCRSLAMRKLEVLQNAYDAISAAATLVAEAKMKGINVRSIARTLIKAKDNFKERNYEEARKLAVASRAEVEQMLLGVKAQEELLRVKNLVSVGNEGGLEMTNMFALLKDVEAAMGKNDSVAALTIIKSIDDELNKIFLSKADAILAEISTLISEVEKSGISITGIKDMSVRASQAVIENEAFEAFHYADVAYKEVIRIKDVSQKATSIIKQSYERINEAEGYHGDASAAKAYLNQAVKFFKLGDFEKAIEFGQKSVEEAEIAEMRLLTRVISDVHAMITSSKKEGVNTALSENLLTRAKQSLDEKKYKEALNLAMKSESELERVGLQQEMASTTITVTETKIQKMKEEGFTCVEAEATVSKAKETFEAGDYIQALELAIQASDTMNRSSEAFTEIKENYNLMRSAVETLEKCRIDIGTLRAESDVVTKNFKDGAYAQVKDAVAEILGKAKGIAEEHSKGISTYCSWFIDFSGTLGVDTQEVKRFFDEGLTYFERKAVDKGMDSMRSIFQFLEPSVKDALGLAITELSTKIASLKSRGVTDSETESMFNKAKDSIESGKYKEAHESILACISKIETLFASIPPEVVVPSAPAEAAPIEPAKSAAPALISEPSATTTAPEPPKPKPDEELKRLKEDIRAGIEGCKKFGFPVQPIIVCLSKIEETEKTSIDQALEKAKECSLELEKVLAKVTPAVEGEPSPLPDKIETGTSIELTVKLKNIAKAVAKDVTIEFEGGVEIVGERISIQMMKGGVEESHRLSIRFTASGDVEFKMKTVYHRIFDNKAFTHAVASKAKVTEPKVLDFAAAETEQKCSLCKGKIKPGFLMFACECGYVFHEPCAIRAVKCPSCARDLPKKKGKSKLALTFG